MSAASTNKGKINPKIVRLEKRGSGSAARGSAESGVKKLAYKPTMKPGWDEVSSNSGGHRRSAQKIGPPEGDVAAGSPKGETGGGIEKIGLSKEAATGESPKKRSRRSPDARCWRRRKKSARSVATATSLDEDSAVPEESGSDDEDVSDEDSEDAGDEENGQLRFGMEPLQRRMYVKGLVALVFARRVTQERLDGGSANHEFQKTFSDIFGGSETPDPDVVRAALKASEARVYLVVMNKDHRFTLVHHLARLDHELRPSNPIVNRIVAFGDDIRPTATSPNVWVFDGRDKDLFAQLHLPEVNLKETQRFIVMRPTGTTQAAHSSWTWRTLNWFEVRSLG
jgi:hypothetical protein